jgi:hypothetical protein
MLGYTMNLGHGQSRGFKSGPLYSTMNPVHSFPLEISAIPTSF